MKIYVWNSPYYVSYGQSCVFAIGHDVEWIGGEFIGGVPSGFKTAMTRKD